MARSIEIHRMLLGALTAGNQVAELAGADPGRGYVMVAGPSGPRVLGAIAQLGRALPERVLGLKCDSSADVENEPPDAIVEVRATGDPLTLRRPLITRPWGLEDLITRMLPAVRTGAGVSGGFTQTLKSPCWMGLAHDSTSRALAEAAAATVALAAVTADKTLVLSAIAAAYQGSLRRVIAAIGRGMDALLDAAAHTTGPASLETRLDVALEESMARLSLVGDREEASLHSLERTPRGWTLRELLRGYATAMAGQAEQGMRRLLDFHHATAGRAFDAARLESATPATLTESFRRRPALLQDPGACEPGVDGWSLAAVDLASGARSLEDIHRNLAVDFPELDVQAVASHFVVLAALGQVELLD